MRGGEEEGDISRFRVDDFISRVHARVREREREDGEFWGTFLSKIHHFFDAHEYITNTQAKHERFFQNLLRSERVQSERFR